MVRSRLFVAVCFIFLLANTLPGATWARDTLDSVESQLERLNGEYRALYREHSQQVLEALPLVLVVQNHTITAVRGSHRRLHPVPLQRYNEARAIVHAALGFHGLMNRLAADPAQADWSRIEPFLQNLELTRALVSRSTLSPEERKQAKQVLDILRATSEEALAARAITTDVISTSLQRIEPVLSDMSVSVGRAHAQNMLRVLQNVQAEATEDEWAQVRVVVTGPMTPRRNNLETAIVASVVGPEHLGRRIFYSENIFDVDGALAYLRTLVVDSELSTQVFGAPQRMWEDLFAPVSRELVQQEFYTELRNK